MAERGRESQFVYLSNSNDGKENVTVSEFCSTNDNILFALYPNATHLIEPTDVSVFKGLKMSWKSKVQEWRINNDFREMKKHEFCSLLQQALQDLDNKCLINGFRKCGLVPWKGNLWKWTE